MKKEIKASRKMSKADETTTKPKKAVDVLDNSKADVNDKHAQEIKKLKAVLLKQKEELNQLRATQPPPRKGSAKAGLLNQTRSGRGGVAIMTQEASAKIDETLKNMPADPGERLKKAIFVIDKNR